MARGQKQTITSLRGCGEIGTLAYGWREEKIMENSLEVLPEVNIESPYHPAIQLLVIYSGKMKTYVHTETRTCMFISSMIHVTQ